MDILEASTLQREGVRHHRAGDLAEAMRCYRTALKVDPDNAQAWHTMGLLATETGRFQGAMKLMTRSLEIQPDNPECLGDLGNVLLHVGRPSEAEEVLRLSLRLRPNSSVVTLDLGAALAMQGQYEPAISAFHKCLERDPNNRLAYVYIGLLDLECGRIDRAEAMAREAVKRKLDDWLAHYNLGTFLLLTERFSEGWQELEWRLRREGYVHPRWAPDWDGSSLRGKTILLLPEQGLGDTIQTLRYAPLLRQRGARVLFHCPEPLRALVAESGLVDEFIGEGQIMPKLDCQAMLFSLPMHFGTTLQSIPAKTPYLRVPPSRMEKWRKRLIRRKGVKVGLVWAGNPDHKNDRNRSMSLWDLKPLLRMQGIQYFSLQKGPAAVQLRECREAEDVVDLGRDLKDFADTAAAIQNLDLVITVDTSVAHLAGALGKPTWVMLPRLPDWRWMIGRAESPWYPSLRLWRQTKRGDWGTLTSSVADELAKRNSIRR
ncbi:MAG: glycosyltransferase family protein [Gammaproteobacteria bacterium]|nr:glycosyltransferase family protein [Gammaproteobacteria bacterium]